MKWLRYLLLLLPMTVVAQPWERYFQAGTTYTGYQHNGSCGRMIGLDDEGYVHVVWMNGLTSSLQPRHAFYNVWDPTLDEFSLANGVQINASPRAGYVTLAVAPDGFGFPCFHESMEEAHTAAAIDFLPRSGAFTTSQPAWMYENGQVISNIWPMIARSMDGKLQVISTENVPGGQLPMRIFYSRGNPEFEEGEFGLDISWEGVAPEPNTDCALVDTTCVLATTIAASPVSNRIVVAWLRPRVMANADSDRNDNDLYVKFSEDGGVNWSASQNLTNFIPADQACYDEYGDWRCCSRDTIRPYRDMSLLFDYAGMLHIAFTTVARYQWMDTLAGPFVQPTKSQIWYWRESTEDFRLVAESWIEDSLLTSLQQLPSGRAMVERPCLAQSSNSIFCSYIQYDTSLYSAAGFLNADLFIARLDDEATAWSVGTNVTVTPPTQVPAPPGESQSETDATMAELTSFVDGTEMLNTFYELDVNANGGASGSVVNDMILNQIEIDDIAAQPTMPARAFHVVEQPCTNISTLNPSPVPGNLSLSAYPNPFNGTLTFSYELPATGIVELVAHDILGREVALLYRGTQTAGTHTSTWNPQRVASGIYFIRLAAGHEVRTQKVMYLK